jgi:hypothetical protein
MRQTEQHASNRAACVKQSSMRQTEQHASNRARFHRHHERMKSLGERCGWLLTGAKDLQIRGYQKKAREIRGKLIVRDDEYR